MGQRPVDRRVLWVWLFALLLAATPAAALDPTRSLAQMSHRVYTRDDGLPGAVEAIAQTPDGYFWIGTIGGLYRFDGVRFEHFTADSQLSSAAIASLMASATGDLWVGYVNGAVSRLRAGVVVTYAPATGDGQFEAQRLWEAPNGGGVWALSAFTPWRFDARTWRKVPGPWADPAAAGGGVWSIAPDRHGALWAKNGFGVYYCRPGCGRFVTASGYAGGVMGLARDHDGRVWTSDSSAPGRMYTMPDISRTSDAAVPAAAFGGQISQQIHGSIFLDRDGALWNVAGRQGLLRVRSILGGHADPNQLDAFKASDGLSSDGVTAVYEDREGSIWVGTNEGLDRFRPANVVLERRIPPIESITGYNGASLGGAIFVFAETNNDNSSPAGPQHGELYRIANDGSLRLVLPKMEKPNAMEPAADGGLWIGADSGLQKLQNGTLTAEPLPPGVHGGQDTRVFGVVEGAAGEPWVSILHHGLWRRTKGAWTCITPGRPDQFNTWALMAFDIQGGLWLIGDDVARFLDGRLTKFSGAAGPNIGHVFTVRADDHGIWFGGEFGLAHYNGRGFQTLRSERLPALRLVSGIVEADGQSWISSQAGLLRFDTGALEGAMTKTGASPPAFELFDRRDGVSGEIQNGPYITSDSSVLKGPDGRIWLLTDRGVDWIDPRDIYRNALPPPVAILSLKVNGRTYSSPRDLRLAAGAANLEIDYAALTFVEPSRVRFRYKLDGVDKDWVDPGERRQVFYTRLGPGTYHFHVIAANDAGVWNRTGAILAFTIAPTFVQSIWFKILVVLALAALAWLASTLRLRRETARLQSSFNVRTAERERIARELHDTLLQGCQGLMLRFQSIANRVPAGDALRESIEDALNRADAVLAEGRARVRDLRSSAASDDLARSLAQAASNIIVGDTPRFHLIVEGAELRLNALVAEEVLRIFEEAIRNVDEHANAQRIDVVLTYARQGLRLSVRDDGVGMAQSILLAGERAGHFGLIGMRERAERVGGRLEVTSREGAGTELVLAAPARAAYKVRSWPPALRSFIRSRRAT